MNIGKYCHALAALCLVSFSAQSQENAGPQAYSYVTYYVCDVATQGNMDNVVEANEYAVFDKWVEEGRLISWGYLSHFTGGRWRRAQFHVSPSMESAFQNQSDIFKEIYSGNRAGGQARSEACEAHDDYLWAIDQGSAPGTDRGDVSLSVYYVCDIADQNRADDIFATAYAPVFSAMQKENTINSWGWQSHVLGGEYRRLLTITGQDYAGVTAAQLAAIRQVNEKNSSLGREFAQICSTHVDYLWDIVHESP